MKVTQLISFLGYFMISACVASSTSTLPSSSAPSSFDRIPFNYFFEPPSGPRVQIGSLSDRSFHWFKEYLSGVSDFGYDLNTILPDGNTLLQSAVILNVPNMIKALIELDVDVLKPNRFGDTALHLAHEMSQTYQGSDDPLKVFTEYGFELDGGDQQLKKIEMEECYTVLQQVVTAELGCAGNDQVNFGSVFDASSNLPPLFPRHIPFKVPPSKIVNEESYIEI